MNDFIEEGRKILKSQPFSCMMGTELKNLSQGAAELSLQIREMLKQNYGFAHGGVVGYLADNCMAFAAATILGDCVTSEYKINYVLPAQGEELIAKSSVLSFSLRQAVCECKVYTIKNQAQSLVAIAQGTIVKVQT